MTGPPPEPKSRHHQDLAIRLTDERLAHILDHPEMNGLGEAIEDT
jgi:hypothetical protein